MLDIVYNNPLFAYVFASEHNQKGEIISLLHNDINSLNFLMVSNLITTSCDMLLKNLIN